ncbi:energy transducer TonB [Panacagrimonas sp.]|uniref:energy transducer TonB n=1 Tax=Panacagrimonas sp. TaxID=2480088 RepID=UPI003B518D86
MNFSSEPGQNLHRLIGLVVVVLLHLLLIWGLLTGLARQVVELIPSPIETKIIEDIRPPPPEPPPPEPDLTPPPPPFIPPPDIVIAPPPKPPRAITQIAKEPPPKPPAPPAPPRKVVRVPARIDFEGSSRACREPNYPSASERLGEQGTSGISLLIGADGKVKETRVDESSGYKRLDAAALRAFGACRFIVGTVDGVPAPTWFAVRYQWVIPD